MKIEKAECIRGAARLPGDKSISHRAALIGGLADGVTAISNFASSADCASTLECIQALGIKVEREVDSVTIRGSGKQGLAEADTDLDCGNSGTTARLISGVLSGQPFRSVLTGDDSLRSRPMRRVIEPLELMGAVISADDGKLPMTIEGRTALSPIAYRLPVASAQVKSCALLAGLNAEGVTSVTEPTSEGPGPVSRDHTELMLKAFGAEIATRDDKVENGFEHTISVSGDSRLTGVPVRVPGDISSAAFFVSAAACLEGSSLTLPGVGINPTRSGVLNALRKMGASIELRNRTRSAGEPVADIFVSGGLEDPNGPVRFSGSVIANLIDELPVLAVVGTRLKEGLEVRGAAELRHKETDRITAVVENLRLMGAEVDEFADGFFVAGSELKGARIDSYGDHRIAMAFAIAGLFAEGATLIDGAECVGVSFPEFFRVLANVVN